jgi:hypothetical protein
MCPGGPFVNAGHNVDGFLDNEWVDGRKGGERPRYLVGMYAILCIGGSTSAVYSEI